MNRAPVMGNVHILVTVLVVTATMLHRLTAGKVQKETELRVYHGYYDVYIKFPYVVTLHPGRFCTGSLITPVWVLTASHCCIDILTHIQYRNTSIAFELTDDYHDEKSEVIKRVVHPGYEENLFKPLDIALLLVSPEVRLDKYGTLSAVDYSTLLGLPVVYVGGGGGHILKRNTHNKIIKKIVDWILPVAVGEGVVVRCDPLWPLLRGFICIAPKCSIKQMTMQGDSGGPLLVDNNIVGVTMGGPAVNFNDNPDRYFTPVSPHQEWIHSVITSKPT